MGMAETKRMKRLFDLQSDNARLRVQLDEVMQDYHKRIDIITNLKNNLSFLNRSIQSSQEQTIELKTKSEKYQEKIKVKEQQLKNKETELTDLENRYKDILLFYTNQLEKINKDVELQRRQNLEDKNGLREQIHNLRSKINELTFEN